MTRTPDDPDANLFYVTKVRHQVDRHASWDGVLSDDDIWKSVLFIKNSAQMKDAPAAVPVATPGSSESGCKVAADARQNQRPAAWLGCFIVPRGTMSYFGNRSFTALQAIGR